MAAGEIQSRDANRCLRARAGFAVTQQWIKVAVSTGEADIVQLRLIEPQRAKRVA